MQRVPVCDLPTFHCPLTSLALVRWCCCSLACCHKALTICFFLSFFLPLSFFLSRCLSFLLSPYFLSSPLLSSPLLSSTHHCSSVSAPLSFLQPLFSLFIFYRFLLPSLRPSVHPSLLSSFLLSICPSFLPFFLPFPPLMGEITAFKLL